jgi:glycosyltransferase involved in cell wall biosynthesis
MRFTTMPKSEKREVVRIAVLNSHPIQYFAPLYAYLNATPDLEVTALYLSDSSIRGGKDVEFDRDVRWDIDLLAGYPAIFLGTGAHRRQPGGFWSLLAPEVWHELRSGRYDVLWLHGHNYAASLIALAAAKTARLRILMRGETHLDLPRGRVKAALRRPMIGTVYHFCDRFLAIGSANADFYRAMGVPEDKIFSVPYAVDNERFMKAARIDAAQKANIRTRYNAPTDRPVVLYAAKFTHRKRPLDLLKAAHLLQSQTQTPFTIIMAGSGELEFELRDYCRSHALGNVVFTGFINQAELPSLYGASDIFVLPSEHEPWGLAVNEAMCAGLPIVVSREVGCVADLVADHVNGFTPAAGDIEGLTAALRRLIDDDKLRRRQGDASLARIQYWGYRQCLDGLRLALADLEFRDASCKLAAKDDGSLERVASG